MTASIPPLRASIELNPKTDDSLFAAQLVDADLGQSLRLDSRGYDVARLLRKEQSVEGLAAELETTNEVVTKVVSLFSRLHLLDTEQSRVFVESAQQIKRWQEANPNEIPLLIRDDAAFTCTMCGSCCGGHNVGPVSAQVVAGLKDKREALLERTGSPKGLFFAVPVGEDGQSKDQIVCHSRGGSCVFLSSEDRCIIHEDYGPQYKPEVCRLFPYQFIATPNGIAVSLSMECRGFAQARGGQPLRNQEKGLRELLSIIPNLRRVRPVILLDDLNPMAYPDYEALEQALHDVVDDQAGDPAQTLLAMRQCVLDALGQGAQEDGGGSDPQTLRDHIVALMQGIEELAEFLTRKYQRDDEEGRVYTETMDELSTAATAFVADLPRIGGPLSSSSQRQVFQQVIHHHLMNKELCSARTLVLGLARLTFSWLMSRALMIARARQVKRRHLVDQDIMDGVVVLNFLMRNQGFMNAFQSFDDALVSLFYERLPALFTHAKEIAGADTRVDFYKF